MIEIDNLSMTYPDGTRALRQVTLAIEPGMFGLLGPNGAGKTTLMRILVGLLAPSRGTVVVAGVDAVAHPEVVQGQLGYLPQDFGFYPHLTGTEMLAHLVELKGLATGSAARQLARRALARVRLTDAARQRVRNYSGGMRQRLAIAQALVGDPAILVLDEPSTGLDPAERDRFHSVLTEAAEDCAVILSTHYVEDVANLCTRFALLDGGRVVADTTPDAASQELAGKVFEGSATAADRAALAERHCVTRSFFVQGVLHLRLHVADGDVPAGFEPVAATLSDAYAVLLARRGS